MTSMDLAWTGATPRARVPGQLLRRPTPVYRERRARDLGRVLRAEERRQPPELVHRHELAGRLLLREQRAGSLVAIDAERRCAGCDLRFDQLGPRPARTDRVTGDPLSGVLERNEHGEPHHAVL